MYASGVRRSQRLPVAGRGIGGCARAKTLPLDGCESPWFCRRLGLLDFDQGLVVPLGIVERGFELCGWDVAEVAV